MKLDARDTLFSRLVRERADWTCERCGNRYERGAQGLHCSHIFSRRARSTRWSPDNAVAKCYPCHMWYGGNPILGGEWASEYLGAAKVARLRRRFHTPMKLSKHDLADILANLKASWKAMQMQRDAGVTGRIEFDDPYSKVMS